MTTSFRQRGSKSGRARLLRIAVPTATAAVVLAVLVFRVPVPAALTGALHSAGKPLWSGRDDLIAAVSATYESLETKDALVRENIALQEELSRLRREAYGARLLMTENERLREMLGRNSAETLVAAVLAGRNDIPFDTFVVDRGARAGVTEGAVVSSAEGLALGYVDRVFVESANVRSFSAPGQITPVVLGTSTPILSDAVGKGAGTYTITMPRDVVVATGTPVVLQTFEPRILGYVDEVISAPEQPFQVLYFRMPKALTQLRFVSIDPSARWTSAEREDEGEVQ